MSCLLRDSAPLAVRNLLACTNLKDCLDPTAARWAFQPGKPYNLFIQDQHIQLISMRRDHHRPDRKDSRQFYSGTFLLNAQPHAEYPISCRYGIINMWIAIYKFPFGSHCYLSQSAYCGWCSTLSSQLFVGLSDTKPMPLLAKPTRSSH